MQTTNTSNFFQSDAQHARASFRAAKHQLHAESGDPIKLNGKPLRVVVRQREGREADAFCAESGFIVRQVGLESGKTKKIFKGHTGPVTSLDYYTVPTSSLGPARQVMISGSWDRSFRVWDLQTKCTLSTTIAHTDFIKALLVIPALKLLVTASSDKDIRLWDLGCLETRDLSALVSSAVDSEEIPETLDETVATLQLDSANPTSLLPPIPTPTGAAPPLPKSRHPIPHALVLKSHIRPPERLGFYPITTSTTATGPDDHDTEYTGRYALVSVDSLGHIKTWEVWRDAEMIIRAELRSDVRPHENGIYDLVIGQGEMWTASVDNSVLLSTFDPASPSIAPVPTLRIPHPFAMRSVLSLAIALPSLNSSHLITGSADESIRIFDLSELDSQVASKVPWIGLAAEGKLPGMVREVEGHSHDVIDLAMFTKLVDGKKEAWLLSASVDGTLRRWRWPDVLRAVPAKKVIIEVDSADQNLLTEEEERELAELMDSDDE